MQKEDKQGGSFKSSYRFRADDYYQLGSPIGLGLGSQDADLADIQTLWAHVQDKKKNQTSRFVSFSSVRQVKFTKKNRIIKIAWQDLQRLEEEGKIKIYTPDAVAALMSNHPRTKIRTNAKNVKAAMKKNAEILIEGQIPVNLVVVSK
ncbi:MAG: hypothetical protein AAGD25_02755 [Cyanobacteria bacterium P01_F01_bin.150]